MRGGERSWTRLDPVHGCVEVVGTRIRKGRLLSTSRRTNVLRGSRDRRRDQDIGKKTILIRRIPGNTAHHFHNASFVRVTRTQLPHSRILPGFCVSPTEAGPHTVAGRGEKLDRRGSLLMDFSTAQKISRWSDGRVAPLRRTARCSKKQSGWWI